MALKTVTREFEGFLEDRKSRFLAHLVPVDMFDQRMEELRKEHKKANHIVTAHRRLLEDDRIRRVARTTVNRQAPPACQHCACCKGQT